MKIMFGFSKIIASYGLKSDELMNSIMAVVSERPTWRRAAFVWAKWENDGKARCTYIIIMGETIKQNEIHLDA